MAPADIVLPQLGETVEEAVIVRWFKGAGDHVDRGETLLEAETDKITVEVPALVAGTLIEVVAPEGSTVKVGGVIARYVQEGRPDAGLMTPPSATVAADPAGRADFSASAASASVPEPVPPLTNRLRASPAARRAARDLGLDLEELRGAGTGPLGRISKADVLAFGGSNSAGARSQGREASGEQTLVRPLPPAGAGRAATPTYAEALPERGGTHELTRIEQVSARLTQRAFQEIPHFYVTLKCDMTATMSWLRAQPEGRRPSLNDVVVKVAALALTRHPRLNSSLVGEALKLHDRIDIGVITATDGGVITSVVPNADSASPVQIHERVREVRGRLREGRAQASDVSGATFCVSNMGMFGIDSFSAIILPPNVAILAVGALKEEVLVEEGRMRLAPTVTLTVSADHRALDGVAVALFLKELEGLFAKPDGWIVG